MNRKAYILLLLFLSWPVNNFFRFFMSRPAVAFRPFIFCDEQVNFQWYLWHLGGSASYIMIFWALWLYINGNYKRERDVITAFGAIFINQVSDIIHYMGWQRHNETFIFLQGFVLIFAAGMILDRQLKKKYGQTN